MQLQIRKPYNALNTETYINIRQQELVTYKKKGYEFYCKELFVFDINPDMPTVLDGENEIILANWPDEKHIICTINNDT